MISSVNNRAPTCAGLGVLRSILLALVVVFPSFAASPTATLVNTNRVLRTVAEIRKLSREEATQKIPVRLNGVITYWGPRWMAFFADETGGVFLNVQLPEARSASEPGPGDSVEVTGVTGPGDF